MEGATAVDTVKDRYDCDYRDRKFGGPDFTHRWILRIIYPKRGKRLLDIGCGQGLLLKEAEGIGLITYGVDISSEAVALAKENVSTSEIICADAHRLKWKDGFFDYITNIGSLEHLQEPDKCLKEMVRVIREGGKICIMLPNLYYYKHIINKVLHKREPTSYQSIERFASLQEWKRLIKEGGLKIDRIYKYNKFNRHKILIFIRALIIPLYFSHHFVFLCSKE